MNVYLDIIEQMKAVKALVIGDAMLDQYVFGRVDRLCPEGPVPVFIPERTETRPGGAAHVTEQLNALCKPSEVFYSMPMTTKTRHMVGHHLLLRVDDDKAPTMTDAARIEILNKKILGEHPCDVIVLSDYAKGWLSEGVCKHIIGFANANAIPVVVDPKGADWTKYAGVTVICPNDREVGASWNGIPWVLHKRGPAGMTLYGPRDLQKAPAGLSDPHGTGRSSVVSIAPQASHVFDVTGAGDIVVALIAAGVGAKASLHNTAVLASLAAGWSVEEVGTVVCSREMLIDRASRLSVVDKGVH